MSITRLLAKGVFLAADYLQDAPPGPRVLIYHQVGAGLGRQMEVTLEDFEKQMTWLTVNREVVDLETALDRWDEPGSDSLVVLSFDDGYADTFEVAYPILRDMELPFVLYIATQSIESGQPLSAEYGAPPLTWAQVKQMRESGLVTLGAHTHSHLDLRGQPPRVIEEEFVLSDQLIERRLGTVPRHFAYPWGYWSAAADPLVRGRYRSAALGGAARPSHNPDRYLLHRYPVQLSDGLRFFKARLRGGLLLEERVRRYLRGYGGP